MNSSHNFKDSPDAIHAGVMATHGATFGVGGGPAKPTPKPNPYAGNTKYHSAFEPPASKGGPDQPTVEGSPDEAARRSAAEVSQMHTLSNQTEAATGVRQFGTEATPADRASVAADRAANSPDALAAKNTPMASVMQSNMSNYVNPEKKAGNH